MVTITDEKEIYVGAYGTLRDGCSNNRLLTNSEHLGTGQTIEKYTLRANGIPFVSKEPLHNVVIDVYKVDDSTLKRLDSLEGYDPKNHNGSWYKREQIPVKIGNKILNAWLYFNEGYSHLPIIKSGDYKKR